MISSTGSGTWMALDTFRKWELEDPSAPGVQLDATLTVSIRLKYTTTVIDTATITLSADAGS